MKAGNTKELKYAILLVTARTVLILSVCIWYITVNMNTINEIEDKYQVSGVIRFLQAKR